MRGTAESHETGPQKPKLKGENGAGDCADSEQHPGRTYPTAGKPVVEFVSAAKGQLFSDHQHERQSDPDGRVDDVEPERDAHQDACRENIIHQPSSIEPGYILLRRIYPDIPR
jgi:hypothetical protein